MCIMLGVLGVSANGASFWERLGLTRRTNDAAASGSVLGLGLSEEQVAQGLKAALDQGVQQAVGLLGRKDGFLSDTAVRIPMPENLKRVETGLRRLGQDQLADEFVTTLNRAAEKAVPEAAQVLGDSVRQMSLADARAILLGTNNAATEYFRRTSTTNLHQRFLPIVSKATEEAGVTAAYKGMVGKAGVLASFLGADASSLDDYITRRALDGLFVKIADEERRIRENPTARTTELLQQVFGSIKAR